ncbi:MAG TPA: glycosyltransferase [Tepidisphaeraceae bacterium]|nr:glycosyltransferase [Tepidisphaeraceae bacterium]
MGLRILHSIRSVNPSGGGPIEGIRQMSVVNRRHGHSVEIVSLDSPDASWVKTCPLICHALGPSFLGYGYSSKFVPWLHKHRSEFDVVVINGIWQYNAFGVWKALRGTGTPYLVFTHGMLDPWFKRTYPIKHLKKWLYWPWADYRVLRDATAVLFTSEEERRLAKQSFWLYRCNENVVNYGTSGPKGDSHIQRRLFAERFPALRDKRLLLFLGRVHPKKGPDLLFNAFARAIDKMPSELTFDLNLVMAGPNDHPYGLQMKRLVARLGIGSRVTWTGMLSDELKWGAFHSADAFILPSHQENFGLAVAEALACRVPVLTTTQVNIWREIKDDGAGLVERDTPEGILALVNAWLRMSPGEQNRMRSRAAECYAKRFDLENTASVFIDILSKLGIRRN